MNLGRVWIQLILVIIIGFTYLIGINSRSLTINRPISADLSDFYEIFKDEILTAPIGNVYQSLGNKFHLDGIAYTNVLNFLNAYDLLRGTYTVKLDINTRNSWISERSEKTHQALKESIKVLNWPRFKVNISNNSIDLTESCKPIILEESNQPVLLQFENRTASSKNIKWKISGLDVKSKKIGLPANSKRYMLGYLDSTSKGQIKFSIWSQNLNIQRTFNLPLTKSGILKGIVVDNGVKNQALARVRITDSLGNYYFPKNERYGLITRPSQKAQRWSYVEGQFTVRLPSGMAKISVRRGLEYIPINLEFQILPGEKIQKFLRLKRWINMEDKGWFSGDTHLHLLDPTSALFEMRAENLRVGNVLVMKHMGVTYSKEYFQGKLDPISDERHLIYYNEEYRNQPLGHIGLLNLKQLVEPISTGGLAIPRTTFRRHSYREPRHRNGWALPLHGEPGWPDSPLLLEVMKRTHRQKGLVNWAHLRASQWEFPIDAALGEIDTVDILTHTRLPQALEFWYHLLNCGIRLPATAGTDRESPSEPVGHQRVYVYIPENLTYLNWIEGLRKGNSFVTNGPVISLEVDGLELGEELRLSKQRNVRIQAQAKSHLPFQRLEVLINGKVVSAANSTDSGTQAELVFDQPINQSSWIAARCMGNPQEEFFDWSHPLFAHTNPIYVNLNGQSIIQPESGCYWLSFLNQLDHWAKEEAYYADDFQKETALASIRQGMNFYRKICKNLKSKNSLLERK